jgi:hypothetical protein
VPCPKNGAVSDGKRLERLVASIEGLLLPNGFTVSTNAPVRDEDSVQIAEFDVLIRGKLGSTMIEWLIECRDRKSEGPAPGSWIEQLHGRRDYFRFNKVTAVSTTGFTKGAVQRAKRWGIDLRRVEDILPEAATWLQIEFVRRQFRQHYLETANMYIGEDESPDRREAAMAALAGKLLGDPQLRSSKTGETISVTAAFIGAVNQNSEVCANILPNHPPTPVKLNVAYPRDDSHFVIDTSLGPVRVKSIEYDGTICITETIIPRSQLAEYRDVHGAEPFAQTATFDSAELSVLFHRVNETGAIYITTATDEENKSSCTPPNKNPNTP